ncbi:unnamed protein product [Rotaria sp. Silwood2]|nr:unnamed protein product [Rotaria sp. Silwood2]CAF2905333.1 unnamed protein product [Rotaria sp. Silwood2]CAF3147977.1 unnamed protein product [Rotaria sp. Silwood2]CAF3330337.1 unnamed protein product [Rotaria sp. Silwood2]CAF4136347.1 unnamed protein product [Rotaria sp. Silwood2]
MNKVNISFSTSYLRFIALFLFIIYVSAKNTDIIIHDQYDNNDVEINIRLPPDISFLFKNINSHSNHPSMLADYDLKDDQALIIPFKKRTIPIELQKALYAHGIVGRRR